MFILKIAIVQKISTEILIFLIGKHFDLVGYFVKFTLFENKMSIPGHCQAMVEDPLLCYLRIQKSDKIRDYLQNKI